MLPRREELLVETFPRGNRHYMVAYPFEGRLAHQTLGMLLTRRLEMAGARPLGFVATDYSLAVWALDDMAAMFRRRQPSLAQLFDQGDHDEMLGKLKVVSMLESLPGVGKVRARRLMEELDISESRRLRGLGDNHRRRLLDRFA